MVSLYIYYEVADIRLSIDIRLAASSLIQRSFMFMSPQVELAPNIRLAASSSIQRSVMFMSPQVELAPNIRRHRGMPPRVWPPV